LKWLKNRPYKPDFLGLKERTLDTGSLKLIEELCNAPGAPGYEDEVLTIARQKVAGDCLIEEDTLRNLYLTRPGENLGGPVVMIEGHSDEVGFMVQFIKPNGLLHLVPMGSWTPEVVLGQRLLVRNSQGEYLTGVVGAKPPHFLPPEQRNQKLDLEDLTLDLGVTSDEEVTRELKVEIGAPVVPESIFKCDEARGVMLGKAFDNRLGCAGVIESMLALKDESLKVRPVGVLSSQEEVGLRGAAVSARKVKPDVAILFEGTPADDTFLEPYRIQGGMGLGPQLRHIDRSMIANPRFARFALDVAEKAGIRHQEAVRSSGGTDGGRVYLSNQGIPTIVLGVPVRYAHTPHCFSSLHDYQGAVNWCQEIIKRLDESIITSF
jgi:putative aminopeptidase FrvX